MRARPERAAPAAWSAGRPSASAGSARAAQEEVARGERFSRRADDSVEEAVHGHDEQAVTRALENATRR
ncbi:hypothetical protein [Streptomyces chromofuscus]|uniref:Uncharacterized protein n=1 Tax=Streptomyces chromofuscus TaxID=42881 RepID=A0A7M2SZN9_STRCW|nr:hypothetical protein [Streptomyces chromofuscus]QOV41782.1 hypothetical protein IPT68_17885 [Streptomyces chromofuscus]